jgi:hypothetical protein
MHQCGRNTDGVPILSWVAFNYLGTPLAIVLRLSYPSVGNALMALDLIGSRACPPIPTSSIKTTGRATFDFYIALGYLNLACKPKTTLIEDIP